MSYLARLFKSFLIIAILSGILTGIFMLVFGSSIDKAISYGAKSGLFISIPLIGICTYYDIIFRQRIFAKLKVRSFDLSQRREIKLNIDLNKVFSRTLTVLKMIPAVIKISPDPVARKITAKIGISLLSFGELIEVELFQENGNTKIVIFSKPRLKTIMVDYGKNIENVEIISALLKDDNKGKQIIQKLTMSSLFTAIIFLSPYAIIAILFLIINN